MLGRLTAHRRLALIFWMTTGCGGAAFETGGDAGPNGATEALGMEAAVEASVCAPLPAKATDVYVDQAFTGTPRTGAPACPLLTIAEGIAVAVSLGGSSTVHVAGAVPALVYKETGPPTIVAGVTLQGEGASQVTIDASGTCTTTTCAVIVEGGGVLDGFTVTSAAGDGVETSASSPAPVVRNVNATGSMGNGIMALGALELGPNVSASGNGNGGLQSPVTASGVVHVVGTANSFDNNAGNGINFDGTATLNFEGGSANGNAQGLRLGGAATGAHTVTSLTATGNTGPGGFVAYNGQTIKLRSSVLMANAGVGLLYNAANGSTLDLGTGPAAMGGNTFGGVTATGRNAKGGLRLCSTAAVVVQPAYGNDWSSCPPTQTAVACGATIGSYSDVVYGVGAAMAVAPVVATACALGP